MERLETGRGGPMFRWLGEPLAIDLANTVLVVKSGDARDLLARQDDLALWLDREADRLGYRLDPEDLPALLELRSVIRSLLACAAEDRPLAQRDVRALNTFAAAAPGYPELVLLRGTARRLDRSSAASPAAEAVGRIARSAIELLSTDQTALRKCVAPNCGMFFVTKAAKPRQWCCAACGNRARVARHYARTTVERQEQAVKRRVGEDHGP